MKLARTLAMVAAWWAATGALAAPALPKNAGDAELTYELRLQKMVREKGRQKMVAFLKQELAENPRSYVKAWYANYLLYGREAGLPEMADPSRGFVLAKEAADEGSVFGIELVGRAWGDGRGTETRDASQAVIWLQKAVDLGRDTAKGELGKFYFFGSGVPQDRRKAEELTRECARQGATQSLFTFAGWWETPAYAGQVDPAKALALYFETASLGGHGARQLLQARAEKGDREAQKYVHLLLLASVEVGADVVTTRVRNAAAWLEKNFPDDREVQVALATEMIERESVVHNLAAAREHLRKAIGAGSDSAREIEARMKWHGIGGPADPAGALAIWKELAARDHPRSLARLGWAHYWGNAEKFGVPKDARLAFEVTKRAADLGDWFAQRNLGECYVSGLGVEKNFYLAAEYYQRVADRGSTLARKMRDRTLALVKD